MRSYCWSVGVVLILGGCVGTDLVDDPIVGERIEIGESQLSLIVGQTASLKAIYYNEYGIESAEELEWISSAPEVATVSGQGEVKALNGGQAMIVASLGSTLSPAVNVTVVTGINEVSSVVISSPENKISLAIGESHTLTYDVNNINNEPLTGRVVEWFSENSSIATVDNMGKVTGVSSGVVDIHAKSEGVKSNLLNFSVGGGFAGTFMSSGGYKTVGMATLKDAEGKIILEFSENFETSFALGTFVYMSNVTNGSQVQANGIEVAQITTNGAKKFDLTAISPGIKLTDYKFVIILCKPARVTFGYAQLN